VTQRVSTGRELVYTDYLGPVSTADEAQVFNDVMQQQPAPGGKVDWVSSAGSAGAKVT
jgi:hypothetical protein